MKALLENGKTITILDKFEIKRGGEGKILTIPELPDQVAKIYLNTNYKHMSKAQKDALSVLDSQLFVKPLELIYDSKNTADILGFTMEYLQADFVPLAALFNKNFCISNHLDDDFKNKLAKKLIEGVKTAHKNDVIIGDLSGLNVLVNFQNEVRFLDVDSYETKVHTHWGLLFDEIRDYLYQGKVSKESDYFAISVLIFSLFTNIHPFKGIHKTYKAMAERMIEKIPVFANDPDLIIPKCYTPLQNPELQKQFEELFLEGKRFLLSIDRQVVTIQTINIPTPLVFQQSDLNIKEIYKVEKDEFIQKAFFTNQLGVLITNQKFLVYDVSNRGYFLQKQSIKRSDYDEMIIGEQHIFAKKQDKLLVQQEGVGFVEISNFKFKPDARYHQINNILIVLEEEYMRYLFLDDVIKDQVRIEQTPVFGKGFDVFNGLIQNTGGMQYVFYHSGKTISTIKSSVQLLSVRITGNVGWACYEEKNTGESTLKYEYFEIQNLQMKRSGQQVFHPKSIAYRAGQGNTGIVFEPSDDKLLVRRSSDFQILQEMDCKLISNDTSLMVCNAGIVAYEGDFCYLLNSK